MISSIFSYIGFLVVISIPLLILHLYITSKFEFSKHYYLVETISALICAVLITVAIYMYGIFQNYT